MTSAQCSFEYVRLGGTRALRGGLGQFQVAVSIGGGVECLCGT